MNKPLLLIFTIGLFIISTLFPIVSSLQPDITTTPVWIGALDVLIALVLVALLVIATTKARDKIDDHVKGTSFHIYQFLAVVPLFLWVIFFLFGDKIRWEILLPGLAWRAWALLYCIPSMVALWKNR